MKSLDLVLVVGEVLFDVEELPQVELELRLALQACARCCEMRIATTDQRGLT